MKKNLRTSCFLLVVLSTFGFIVGCADLNLKWEPRQDTYQITILHTNDHHGRFWKNSKGEYGMAARKTAIDRIRSEVLSQGGFVLLLDAGDVNTGVPESKMLNAKPDIHGMNLLGYDAMALGNHEFDNPLSTLRSQQSWMNFPLLSANIYDKTTRKRLFPPYASFNFKDLTIIILGLITEDTVKQGNPDHIKGLEFAGAIETCRDLVPRLKRQSDILIALTHLGHYPDGAHGSNATGSVSLARAVDGIDVIVDGHTHTKLEKPDIQNNTIIVQAGEYGKYLGRLDIVFSGGKLTKTGYRLIPINLKTEKKIGGKTVPRFIEDEIDEDPYVERVLANYQASGSKKLKTIIGTSTGKFEGDRTHIRNFETAIGNLVCRAAMAATSADLSLMNSGGIRAGLPAGAITYKDVLKVNPFGNTICTVMFYGKELTAYLEKAVNMGKDTGAFAQISGATVFVSQKKITRVLIQGKPVSNFKNYKLAVSRYMASGGDGYPIITEHPGFVDTGFVDADVLKAYITKNSPLNSRHFMPEHNVVHQ